MGGRIASQLVAAHPDGLGVAGLVLLGYPLHPPARPDKVRSAHLSSIKAPILFVQGTRDTFGTPEELRSVVSDCQNARLHLVEGGDHSFKRRGQTALSPKDAPNGIQDAIEHWIRAVVLLDPGARAKS